jgi:hypothetical protein
MGIQDAIRGDSPASASAPSPGPSAFEMGMAQTYVLPYTGTPYSHIWWMMAFQLVVGVALAAAAAVTPKLRLSALALVTVLTTSCFLLTERLCNAYLGVYQLTHNTSGTAATVTNRDSGFQHTVNAIMVLFAGSVICSVANALTLVFLGVAASPAEGGAAASPAAAPAKEEEAAPAAAEAAV